MGVELRVKKSWTRAQGEERRRKDVKTLRLEKFLLYGGNGKGREAERVKGGRRKDGIGERVYRTRINQRLTGAGTF